MRTQKRYLDRESEVSKMGLFEIIIIILLITWAFGGLLVMPFGGGVLNLLLTIVIIWIIVRLLQGKGV